MNTATTNQYDELKSLLIKCLPKRVNASNKKDTANNRENRNIPRMKALNTCSFLYYNLPSMVSLLIFDIDQIEDEVAVKRFSLQEMVHEIYRKTGRIPTYTLKTSKGYHFAFHLKTPVFLVSPKAKQYIEDIKRAIGQVTYCDAHGSHRLYGVWRNPLLHDFWYSGEKDYSLSDFDDLCIQNERKIKYSISSLGPLNVEVEHLIQGDRNDKLFLFSIKYCLVENPSCTQKDLETYLISVNKQAQPPLEMEEVVRMAKNTYKRKIQGKLYIPKKDVNHGAMNLPKIPKMTNKEFAKEVKNRQKLAAEYTNKILVSKKSRLELQEAMTHARNAREMNLEAKNRQLIIEAIALLKAESKKLSIFGIAKVCKLDRRTVKKYVELFNLLKKGYDVA